MANYATLKAAINAAIKQNGNNEITGSLLQQQLLAMVNSLGVGYQYVGVAAPDTNPGTPDQNVFYFASTAGTYVNFNGLVLTDGEIAILKYNGAWSKDSIGAASLESVNQLGQQLGQHLNQVQSEIGYKIGEFLFSEAGEKPYSFVEGNTYVVTNTGSSGFTISIRETKDGESHDITYVGVGETVEITASINGYWVRVGQPGAFNIILKGNINSRLNDIEKEDILIEDSIESLCYNGFSWTNKKIFNIEAGHNYEANNNFISSTSIPQGTKIQVKLIGTTGVLSQVWLVNQDYNTLYKSSDYVDGTLLEITLEKELTSMGLYIVSSASVGSGDVRLLMFSNVTPSIGKRLTIAEQEIDELKVYYKIADASSSPSAFFKGKSSGCEYTTDGVGIIMPAGVNIDNYLGIKYSSLYGLLPNLYGKKLHIKFVCSADGEDAEKLNWRSLSLYPDNQMQIVSDSVVYKTSGNFIITEFDIQFPENGTIMSDGQFYLNLKTDANSSPVTIKALASYYAITNVDTAKSLGDTEGAGELTYGIREISKQEAEKILITPNTTILTCKPFGTSGIDADFCGLTAIADAINSITDASISKHYAIHVQGIFLFTEPLTVPMNDAGGEYSIILKKDYVDIIGDGPNKSAVIMDFPANATFHDGKSYSDYQPVYFRGAGGKISGMSIIGRNCRYAFHIENGPGADNKVIDIDNCSVWYKGHPDYTGNYGDCFGTGISNGQTWNIKNTIMQYHDGNAFAMHTPLAAFNIPAVVNFENCTFIGNIAMHNYQVENNVFANFVNCNYGNGIGKINCPYYNNLSISKHADYTTILLNAAMLKALYTPTNLVSDNSRVLKGAALRVISNTTGDASTVRFNKESSAYDAIIGDSRQEEVVQTPYYWDEQYGQVYRDGGVGIAGQAFGTWDLDPTGSAGNSIGARLGDCSMTNKQLVISVDGVSYTVTFNADYTLATNDDMIAIINAALGEHATADLFSPARLYYPNINNMQLLVCNDENSILRGMGVVFDGGYMRRATNSDGYIDGICLDDCANGQVGRVIKCGYLYPQWARTTMYYLLDFTTLDNAQYSSPSGTLAGISATNPGEFDINASPKLLRLIRTNPNAAKVWEIL